MRHRRFVRDHGFRQIVDNSRRSPRDASVTLTFEDLRREDFASVDLVPAERKPEDGVPADLSSAEFGSADFGPQRWRMPYGISGSLAVFGFSHGEAVSQRPGHPARWCRCRDDEWQPGIAGNIVLVERESEGASLESGE